MGIYTKPHFEFIKHLGNFCLNNDSNAGFKISSHASFHTSFYMEGGNIKPSELQLRTRLENICI